MKRKTKKTVWFAKGGGIARVGPFASQIEATKALRLAHTPANQNNPRPSRAEFPADAFVWPEEQ